MKPIARSNAPYLGRIVARRALLITACAAVLLSAGGCKTGGGSAEEVPDPRFPEGWSVIDLTRPLDQSAPYLPGTETFPFERLELEKDEKSGLRSGLYSLLDRHGTHVIAPAAYAEGGATIERVAGSLTLLPLVVIDAPTPGAGAAASDGAPQLTAADLVLQETRWGALPPRSAVLLRTGYGTTLAAGGRGHEAGAYARIAGFDPATVDQLARQGGAALIGTDALSIDIAAQLTSAPASRAAADAGLSALVALGDLSALPERGAWLVVGVLPVVGGTGCQARVLALVPPAADLPKPRPIRPALPETAAGTAETSDAPAPPASEDGAGAGAPPAAPPR